MANLTQIELPNGTTYDIEDAKKKGVYVVKGTHTTATVAWTGAIDVDALYDGLTIAYYLPISATSGSTQVTLNLTLSGGTTTGAVNCYYNASKLTRSYYPAGSNILMTYWSAGSISISGTATTDNRWIAGADYNANTWRNITIDGTQAYSTSTSSGALALISGTNVNIASDGGAPANVTISATDTTYSMTRDGESVKLTPSSGTAQTVGLSDLINGLGEGTSPAQGNDYLVAQYAGGGTTNTTYYRRKVSNIVNATNVKTALGTDTSTTTQFLNKKGEWATPPDTKNTAGSTDTSSKIFLIGATSQAANPQTYSDNEVYATSGVLTTKSVQIGGGSCTMQYNTATQSCDFVFT